MLEREQARRVYDRMGKRLDSQAFYEDRSNELLLQHGEFSSARHIFEFGCGTGRLALRLLGDILPDVATYRAVDLSPVMVEIASQRLAPFSARVELQCSSGEPPVDEPAAAYDRFICTYVLDLLPEDEIAGVLREAHRMLAPGGLLCLSSLSSGSGPGSRVVARAWSAIHAVAPALVGGCRPLELRQWLSGELWKIRHRERISPFMIPLEIVVAERV